MESIIFKLLSHLTHFSRIDKVDFRGAKLAKFATCLLHKLNCSTVLLLLSLRRMLFEQATAEFPEMELTPVPVSAHRELLRIQTSLLVLESSEGFLLL